MSDNAESQRPESVPTSAVVFHGGRRYRRATLKVGIDEREKEGVERGRVHSAVQLPPMPRPPSNHVMNRRILSAELIRSPQITFEACPFQRFKPLPAIGSRPDVCSPDVNSKDHTSPTTATVSVCVRLPDGSRSNLTLPISSPLSSLVTRARGRDHSEKEDDGWSLCTSEVPKRELSNLSLTLQETGITLPCMLHLVPPDPPSPPSPSSGSPLLHLRGEL